MMHILDSEDEVQGSIEKSGSKSHCQPHEGTRHTACCILCDMRSILSKCWNT